MTRRTCSLQESRLPGGPLWPNLSAGRTLGLAWLSRSAVPHLYILRTDICICRLWSANKPIRKFCWYKPVNFPYMFCFKDRLQQSFVIVDNMIPISHVCMCLLRNDQEHTLLFVSFIHSFILLPQFFESAAAILCPAQSGIASNGVSQPFLGFWY